MAKRQQLTVEQRSAIYTLRAEGYSERKIAKRLKISCKRKKSERPKSTTIAEDNFIIVTSKRDRRLTAPAITAALNESRQTPVSTSTVKRQLLSAELRECVAVKKSKLTARHKQNRLKWAKHYINWSIKKWNKVLWTDESKFEIYGSNWRVFVCRQMHEKTIEASMVPTIKHGGRSVMVWGCLGNKRSGNLFRINGILKKEGYLNILQDQAIPSKTNIIGLHFIYQQDNNRKHSSKLCKTYLLEKKGDRTIKIMDWPSQSPDLSPIELVWDELDRRVKIRSPTSAKQLWQYLEEWATLNEQYFEKIINRMGKICRAVIQNKGGHFDEYRI
ncbi:hypothetical protein ILUMI_22087 [Ignelater luminosus]|uniref:Transposase n=1 Tax=Ignelater luminosus TaxID=2038154 RepID=A0A8K0FXJ6_IGNLU|nr:hypothetical protein ILUMI_22087 [Ignelater luminosus]